MYVAYVILTDVHIKLQEKMLEPKNKVLKLDDEYLQLLSGEVGSRWPSLAVSLSLSEKEMMELREMVGLSEHELALQMLRTWVSKENATYSQLYHKLNAISLFQHT